MCNINRLFIAACSLPTDVSFVKRSFSTSQPHVFNHVLIHSCGGTAPTERCPGNLPFRHLCLSMYSFISVLPRDRVYCVNSILLFCFHSFPRVHLSWFIQLADGRCIAHLRQTVSASWWLCAPLTGRPACTTRANTSAVWPTSSWPYSPATRPLSAIRCSTGEPAYGRVAVDAGSRSPSCEMWSVLTSIVAIRPELITSGVAQF